jgi:hypothetical protein
MRTARLDDLLNEKTRAMKLCASDDGAVVNFMNGVASPPSPHKMEKREVGNGCHGKCSPTHHH